MTQTRKRIFISGGASGLGRALAFTYAKAGWDVYIGDVNEKRGVATARDLKTLHPNQRVEFRRCDVTLLEDLQAVSEWLKSNWGGVDTVVNNAGVVAAGALAEQPLVDWEWILNINLLGVVRGCKVFTPLFRAQGHGQFINIASAAGFAHLPRMAAYNATKAAVIAVSETLVLELKADHIHVSVVCPTFFRTHLIESLRTQDAVARSQALKLVTEAKLSAEMIAVVIHRQAEKKRFMIMPDPEAYSVRLLKGLLPLSLFFRLLERAEKIKLER